MHNKEILLGSAKHKLGINEDNFIDVELSVSEHELGVTEDSYAIDEYLQYYHEKDSSQNYRLAFTIVPYCTNVLFNVITEPVYKECSDECVLITNSGSEIDDDDFKNYHKTYKGCGDIVNLSGAVSDTGYSLPEAGGIKYHCGYDIFDNHYFRKLGFVIVNKLMDGSMSNKFNTIEDSFRDNNGNVVKYFPLISNGSNSIVNERKPASLYKKSTVLSYFDSIDKNLSEENGWFGFVNKSIVPVKNYRIKIDNKSKFYTINKCMNDCEAGDFVDMYPDRTMFSFVPKYNEYRKRIEKNWDYCITYPSHSANTYITYDEESDVNGILSIKISEIMDYLEYPQNTVFKTAINHNLSQGDYITLSFILNGGEVKKTGFIRVVEVGLEGEDAEHYFSVRTSSILNNLFNAQNRPIAFKGIRVRKCEEGAECEYYVRMFSKLKDEDYNSQVNKLGFAQNAYSDPVAQVLFTEDINTEGLADNLNRPVSELYLTLIKANRGHVEWYEEADRQTDKVEYSHCFGKVTSGFDLPDDNAFREYNVHRIHNINADWVPESPSAIEDDITIEQNEFYGDIVEFSPVVFRETSLTPVYHRFNTAQRECDNEEFKDFVFHEIGKDLYDGDETTADVFSAAQYFDINKVNLLPEGYYYKPHYLVKVRDFSEDVSEGYHIPITYTAMTSFGNVLEIQIDKNYYFQAGFTKIYLYKNTNGKYYELKATGVCSYYSMEDKIAEISFENEVSLNGDCKLFKHNTEMPDYAYDLQDGSGKYIWREVMSFMDVPADNELYDTQFTNGAHYHHKNIQFYLKRQDPDGRYGIGQEPVKLSAFMIENERKDVSDVEYKEITNNVKC